nr:MAG TPA: hypothetical protein [Caudoviricetes sp.]
MRGRKSVSKGGRTGPGARARTKDTKNARGVGPAYLA